MSMMTTLSGCDVAKLRRAVGTADETLAEAVRARVEQDVRRRRGVEEKDEPALEKAERAKLAVILDKLQGKPTRNLGDEGHMGYLAATALLDELEGDDRFRTEFEVKHLFFWNALLDEKKALGKDAALFELIENGRPLFGKTILNECLYAWFTREEAIRLRDAAKRVAESPDVDEDLVEVLAEPDEGFVDCIDQILDAGHDVWVEAT